MCEISVTSSVNSVTRGNFAHLPIIAGGGKDMETPRLKHEGEGTADATIATPSDEDWLGCSHEILVKIGLCFREAR